MEQKQFYYAIQRILDCGFFIEEAINASPTNTKIGYAMNFLFDVENSWIEYLVRADFTDHEGNTFLSGTVKTVFSVNELKSFVDENNNVQFPPNSLEVLFGIAFGHLRAILAKNSAGTRFKDFYIPVINPAEIFDQLLQMNIEKFKKAQESGQLEIVKKEKTNKKTKKS